MFRIRSYETVRTKAAPGTATTSKYLQKGPPLSCSSSCISSKQHLPQQWPKSIRSRFAAYFAGVCSVLPNSLRRSNLLISKPLDLLLQPRAHANEMFKYLNICFEFGV